MIHLGDAGMNNGFQRERLLAALLRSQCAIADLLDDTAELRRSIPLSDDELAEQQRSAALALGAQLQQALELVLIKPEHASSKEEHVQREPIRVSCKTRHPGPPWLATGVFRGHS